MGEGYFEVTPGGGTIQTKESFGDVQLHVEWASPSPARGTNQDRGNSGIFLRVGDRYFFPDRTLAFVDAGTRLRVGDRELAEDVAQAAFIVLAQKGKRLPPTTMLPKSRLAGTTIRSSSDEGSGSAGGCTDMARSLADGPRHAGTGSSDRLNITLPLDDKA